MFQITPMMHFYRLAEKREREKQERLRSKRAGSAHELFQATPNSMFLHSRQKPISQSPPDSQMTQAQFHKLSSQQSGERALTTLATLLSSARSTAAKVPTATSLSGVAGATRPGGPRLAAARMGTNPDSNSVVSVGEVMEFAKRLMQPGHAPFDKLYQMVRSDPSKWDGMVSGYTSKGPSIMKTLAAMLYADRKRRARFINDYDVLQQGLWPVDRIGPGGRITRGFAKIEEEWRVVPGMERSGASTSGETAYMPPMQRRYKAGGKPISNWQAASLPGLGTSILTDTEIGRGLVEMASDKSSSLGWQIAGRLGVTLVSQLNPENIALNVALGPVAATRVGQIGLGLAGLASVGKGIYEISRGERASGIVDVVTGGLAALPTGLHASRYLITLSPKAALVVDSYISSRSIAQGALRPGIGRTVAGRPVKLPEAGYLEAAEVKRAEEVLLQCLKRAYEHVTQSQRETGPDGRKGLGLIEGGRGFGNSLHAELARQIKTQPEHLGLKAEVTYYRTDPKDTNVAGSVRIDALVYRRFELTADFKLRLLQAGNAPIGKIWDLKTGRARGSFSPGRQNQIRGHLPSHSQTTL
jgi:hypothetical protein